MARKKRAGQELEYIREASPWVVEAVRKLWKDGNTKTIFRVVFKKLHHLTYGSAWVQRRKIGWIQLNLRRWKFMSPELRRVTVLHELGHIYVDQRYGRHATQAHGAEWRKAMRRLGLPDERAVTKPIAIDESKADAYKVHRNRA